MTANYGFLRPVKPKAAWAVHTCLNSTPYGENMRWDRLFAELEDSTADAKATERDALAAELHDANWAKVGWLELLGGEVTCEVQGYGRIQSPVRYVGELIIFGQSGPWTAVNPSAVLAVCGPDGRVAPAPKMRRTRAQFARMLRAQDAQIRITRTDSVEVVGTVEAVGEDFIQLRAGHNRVSLPWVVIATLSQA